MNYYDPSMEIILMHIFLNHSDDAQRPADSKAIVYQNNSKRGLCPRTPVFVGLWASPGLRLMIAVGKYYLKIN